MGYNHEKKGYSLSVADIDGLKIKNPETGKIDYELQAKSQEIIYDALKGIENCWIVKTQSGGYHFYFLNRTVIDKQHGLSKSLKFPKNTGKQWIKR